MTGRVLRGAAARKLGGIMGHTHRGFSLLETTLATALLCAVAIFLFNLYPASAMSIRQSQDRLVADSLAQSILEEYKAAQFTTLNPGKTSRPSVAYGDQGSFYPEVEIYPVGTDPQALVGVRVSVRWQSPRGPRTEQYEMILANLEQ